MGTSYLKHLREEQGLTQEFVAEILDVSTSTIQNWEREGKFRNIDDFHRLLDVYDADATTRAKATLEVFGSNESKELFERLLEKEKTPFKCPYAGEVN